MAPPRIDFRHRLTQQIVDMLDRGVAPWQKPWDAAVGASLVVPRKNLSGEPYRGKNVLWLMLRALESGYRDPRWMSFNFAREHGWHVRRGEKGTQVEFWERKPRRSRQGAQEEPLASGEASIDQAEDRYVWMQKVFTVFNAEQVEGVPAYVPPVQPTYEPVEAAERIIAACGVSIVHDQIDRAFYSRSSDRIHVPPRAAFKSAHDYYATVIHEQLHATGHPTRLDRPTLNESYRFGDPLYAEEEGIVELGTFYVLTQLQIPRSLADIEQHAAYMGHWADQLRKDKHAIFTWAGEAMKAANYLLQHVPELPIWQQVQQSPEPAEDAYADEVQEVARRRRP